MKYPDILPKVKKENNKEFVFCVVRKRWMNLKPEEWVRQNFLNFLIFDLHYPQSLMSVEKKLTLGEMDKRYDIVMFDKNLKPWILVECKEMNVKLDEKALRQILNYNQLLDAPYFVITNGNSSYLFKKQNNKFEEIDNFPTWDK